MTSGWRSTIAPSGSVRLWNFTCSSREAGEAKFSLSLSEITSAVGVCPAAEA